MRELAGKTAFVTGGASGIGLALGRAFAEAGMKVMLADIEARALAAAVEGLAKFGPDVRGIGCDVTDPASVERAAEAAFAALSTTSRSTTGNGCSTSTWRASCTESAPSCRISAPTAKAVTSSTPPRWPGW
jgi:NAD(P)-dependent dehydrogenase (short-subunit alcohol dehydrogenase family)